MITEGDLELLEQLAAWEARESFHAFRQYMHPKLKLGWFIRSLDDHLQNFYRDLVNNQRPKLAIVTPPQHGKSSSVVDFICWISGKSPHFRTIYTSFSERLGVRANLAIQRMLDSSRYQRVFELPISSSGRPDRFGATRNRELIEFIDQEGCFRNTTVKGSITGEGLDLGIVDDPLKGREAANSQATRDSIWDWMTDDFLTRFSDEAGLLAVGTRWHVDDPISRLRESFGEDLRVIRYPAFAEPGDPFRAEGEPLFPALKSKEFLMGVKAILSSTSWAALYQGSPVVIGGNIIRGEWFRRYSILPKLVERNIYVDTAQKTQERNDYTVFACYGKGVDGRVYLVDQLRGKWEAPEMERKFVDFWIKHKAQDSFELSNLRKASVEDSSAGTGLIQKIKAGGEGQPPIPIKGVTRSKDKYTRVSDVLGYIESGWVSIPEHAPFVSDFIAENEAFTADDSHDHDDQIDPMVDAIEDYLGVNNVISLWSRLAK